MGIFSSRSSSVRPEGSKTKWRKGKRKGVPTMETSVEGDQFLTQEITEQKMSNGNLINTYEEWNDEFHQQQIANLHGDPPGAPSTYPMNYPMMRNNLMSQSWSSNYDGNNQYYPGNSLPMTSSHILYDSNQYMHNQFPNTFMNQSQHVMLEERPSKKVQFARPIQQQVLAKNPLTTTQSWHEPSVTSNDESTSATKQEQGLSRKSVHRSVMPKTNSVLAEVPIPKPIYIGIDYRATLAERGQTIANKHLHKTTERSNSDGVNRRSRSHTHHQHKHQELNDFPSSKTNMSSSKSFDPIQSKSSTLHRSLTTTSTSTGISNKQMQHTEQSLFNDNDIRIPKTRGNHGLQTQHTEKQSSFDNDIKSLRNKGNHTQQRQQQQQQRPAVNRNNSPLRTEVIRRMENKRQGSPVMKNPTSQSRQKQSTMITTANITRTRV